MPINTGKRIVVDASVARASGGEDAIFPISKQCRDFLLALKRICHTLVVTPEIQEEWKRHQSGFARRWMRTMYARRKVCRIDSVTDAPLRTKLSTVPCGRAQREAMLKDCHLVEAAMATDWAVVSLDDAMRNLLREASGRVGEIRAVIWVNPGVGEEASIS